ncbi:unnamed protein product [Brachionus calyciflorus]|uniref:V-SNARE coiled-coil homology domain-containing protein n=1 Tax=Brachionus calyciflorus TaxID=104777 RepID=A0A813T1T4_9BILA|nr:unnamed protein product [Brachionus calyciflorus]
MPPEEPANIYALYQAKIRERNKIGRPSAQYIEQISKFLTNDNKVKLTPAEITNNFISQDSKMSYSYQNNAYRQSEDGQIRQNQEQVNAVKQIVHQNIEKLYERGEKLEDLNRKADNLQYTASEFQKTTVKTNRLFMWKNFKWALILAFVVVAVIVIIVLSIWLNVK